MTCQFWLDDFHCLFKNISLFPEKSQNEAERLNSMTWIIIIVSLVLWGFRVRYWWLFLIIGLILVFILYLSWKSYSPISHFTCSYKHKEQPIITKQKFKSCN